jgi:arylformamidase
MNLGDYEIIDLSLLLVPGQEERRLELRRQSLEFDDTYYCDLDTMSHIGTHVEAPLHFYGRGPGVADLPLQTFVGEAVLVDLYFLPEGAEVQPEDLRLGGGDELQAGTIAVLTARRPAQCAVHLTAAAAAYLAEKRIKMLAFDDSIGLGRHKATARAVHDCLMALNIPLLERLTSLEALPQRHFLLWALPWRVAGLDSSPVRAVALVPRSR